MNCTTGGAGKDGKDSSGGAGKDKQGGAGDGKAKQGGAGDGKAKQGGAGDGKAEQGGGGDGRRMRRANQSAAMTCEELQALFKSKGVMAKAAFKKLKDAKAACGAGTNATDASRMRRANDCLSLSQAQEFKECEEMDFTGFSCVELDAEIKSLEAEALAAGLVLKASSSGPGVTTV